LTCIWRRAITGTVSAAISAGSAITAVTAMTTVGITAEDIASAPAHAATAVTAAGASVTLSAMATASRIAGTAVVLTSSITSVSAAAGTAGTCWCRTGIPIGAGSARDHAPVNRVVVATFNMNAIRRMSAAACSTGLRSDENCKVLQCPSINAGGLDADGMTYGGAAYVVCLETAEIKRGDCVAALHPVAVHIKAVAAFDLHVICRNCDGAEGIHAFKQAQVSARPGNEREPMG
jgi:hypothetical protein